MAGETEGIIVESKQASISYLNNPKKELYTRIREGDKKLTTQEAKDKFTQDQVKNAEDVIGKMTSSKEANLALKQMAKKNPLFQGKRIPESVVLKIQAIEALNDVVQNTEFYQNESPNDPLYKFYQENKSLLSVRDSVKLPVFLDYLRANTIVDYNDNRTDEHKPQPLRRRLQMDVKSDEDFDLEGVGKYEKILEKVKTADGTEIPKVKREIEADLVVYQVLKRQIVPSEIILRWSALKQGVLASEGSPEEQIQKMVAEQQKWDEKIRDALKFDKDNPRVDSKVFDKVQEVMTRFHKEGFQAVFQDEKTMMINESQKQEIKQAAGLNNLSDEDFDKVFKYAATLDQNRLNKLNGHQLVKKDGEINWILGRYDKLSQKQSEEKSINFDSAVIRERAFKIVRLLIRRAKDIPQEEELDEQDSISLRKFIEKSGKTSPPEPVPEPVKPPEPVVPPEPIIPPEPVTPPEPIIPPVVPPKPEEPDKPREIEFGMVGAKAEIGGEGRTEKERYEEVIKLLARQVSEERRKIWEGRLPNLGRATSRFWKHTLGQDATYKKNKDLAVKMIAESGLSIHSLPDSFREKMDNFISDELIQQRTGLRKFTGWVKDRGHDLTFTEADLDQRRVTLLRELRNLSLDQTTFNSLTGEKKELATQFLEVLKGDYQASEDLAKTITKQIGGEFLSLQTGAGEKRAGEVVEIQGPARDFLINKVVNPILTEGLNSNGNISENTIMKARSDMKDFFTSKEFIAWYDNQTDNVKQNFNLSLSYGSELIPVVQEFLLPQALEMKDHLASEANLKTYLENMVLKTRVGTRQAEKGRQALGENFIEKRIAQSINHQRVLDMYEGLRSQGQNPTLVHDTIMQTACDRADLLKKALATSAPMAAVGVGVALGTYAGARLAGSATNIIAPVVGGALVGGAVRGAIEYRTLGTEKSILEVESTEGYKSAQDARRRQELARFEIHKRSLADRTNEMTPLIQRGENLTTDEALSLLGFVSENDARVRICEQSRINLFKAKNPQSYQTEQLNFEIANLEAKLQLKNVLSTNTAVRDQILARLGIAPLANADASELIFEELTDAMRQNIQTGAGINSEYQAALGNLTLTESESIDRRLSAFETWRRQRALQTGATTAVLGAGGFFVSREVIGFAVNQALEHDIPGVRGVAERLGAIKTLTGKKEVSLPGTQTVKETGLNLNLPNGFKEEIVGNQVKIIDVNGQEHFYNIGRNVRGFIENLSPVNPDDNLMTDVTSGYETSVGGGVEKITKVIEVPPDPSTMTPEQKLAWDLNNFEKNPQNFESSRMVNTENLKFEKPHFHVLWPEHVEATGDHAGRELQLHLGEGKIHYSGNLIKGMVDPLRPGLPPRIDPTLEGIIDLSGGKIINQDIFATITLRDGSFIYAPLDQNGDFSLPDILKDASGKPNISFVKEIGIVVSEKTDGSGVLRANEWFASGHNDPGIPLKNHYLASVSFGGENLPNPPEATKKIIEELIQKPGKVDFVPSKVSFRSLENIFEERFESNFGFPIILPRQPLEAPEGVEGPMPPPGGKLPEKPTPTPIPERQKPQQEGEIPVEERFQTVVGEPKKENNPFYIENPPEKIENIMEDDEIKKLAFEPQKPFFTEIELDDNGKGKWHTNPQVVPWAKEFTETSEKEAKNPRFVNAEESTNNDSGLFAVCAASSSTPEKQAALYNTIAKTVVKVHENPQVLTDWLKAQSSERDANNRLSSFNIFYHYDHSEQGGLRPENERLVALNEGIDQRIRNSGLDLPDDLLLDISHLWTIRIDELNDALSENKLSAHHLRWIEFLSHSVNVPEIIRVTQAKQPVQPVTTSTPPLNSQAQAQTGQATVSSQVEAAPYATETLNAEMTIETDDMAQDLEKLKNFAKKDTLESKETYEKSLNEVLRVLEGKDGIAELEDLPTIVIPDIHARREFLTAVLDQEVKEGPLKGRKNFDLLKEGKINVVCLGDGMHSEKEENWVPEIRGITKNQLLTEEMTRSLGTMKMIMDLKTKYPENFHYLRGNHDDITESLTPYRKFANESYEVKTWIIENFSQDFLNLWAHFDAVLPLLARGKNFVASHACPENERSETEIESRDKKTTYDFVWTDNRNWGPNRKDRLDKTLSNLGMDPNASTWIIGHRPVEDSLNGGKYREQFGNLIQINNPQAFIYAYVPNDRKFDPDKEVYKI